MKKVSIWVIVTLIAGAGLFYYSIQPAYNPLQKYGVVLDRTVGESKALDILEFHLEGQPVGKDNPGFSGDHLTVSYKDLDGDGIEEIIVASELSKDSRAVTKVIVEGGKAVGFHIVEANSICVGFAKEGYYCP